jgi:hypothetical protein
MLGSIECAQSPRIERGKMVSDVGECTYDWSPIRVAVVQDCKVHGAVPHPSVFAFDPVVHVS